jgi:hypothetical protein
MLQALGKKQAGDLHDAVCIALTYLDKGIHAFGNKKLPEYVCAGILA